MAQLRCLRCGAKMRFAGQEKLQLGKTGWLSGDLPNLLAGALSVSIMECPHCGKLEFFSGRADVDGYGGSDLPQRTCPKCGAEHDFDYPKCPLCGYVYGTKDEF